MNDFELNNLEYEKALIYDNRNYCKYYWSLLKSKHLILFAFLPTNDYNLISIKMSIFLLSFSLYISINCFFFNDKTMHKVYKDKGNYNILYQISQVIYSCIISSIFNSLIKMLSLSEKNILSIKKQTDKEIAIRDSIKI